VTLERFSLAGKKALVTGPSTAARPAPPDTDLGASFQLHISFGPFGARFAKILGPKVMASRRLR
jgi:hypothetical protein